MSPLKTCGNTVDNAVDNHHHQYHHVPFSIPTVLSPVSRHNEIMSVIDRGLMDISVSRLASKSSWGIPVPNDANHTMYVWLDALTNYLSAVGYSDSTMLAEAADYHIVGKDIVKFHAIYWPAFLMAANRPLPRRIIAHAHWTVNQTKMSKSLGNVIDPMALLRAFGSDAVRYYLLREGTLEDDTDFSETMLLKRYNNELADQFGNLLFRAVNPIFFKNHRLPIITVADYTKEDQQLINQFSQLRETLHDFYIDMQFSKGLDHLFHLLMAINRYFTANAPWQLVKEEGRTERLNTVMYVTLEAYRLLALLYQPVLPNATETILNRLGVQRHHRTFQQATWSNHEGGRLLGDPIVSPFQRIVE